MFRQSKPPAGMRASAIVLGSFDGVHLGHQALLAKAKALADRDGLAAVAITFRQHPLSVLCPDRAPALLSTGDERARLMQAMGMDGVVELEFTPALAGTQPEEFIRWICSMLPVRHEVVGYNYTFGFQGQGDASLLERLAGALGFTCHVVPPVALEGGAVSSSRIRACLAEGDTLAAGRLLGRPYGLGGVIEQGKQLGRRLGFPTLNIDFPTEKAVPSAGVYTGWVSYGGVVVPAVTNIGTNPTVESGRRMRLETHTLEETPLGYGDRAQAWFGERLRGECRFASVEALQAQVLSDKETARAWGRTHRLGQLWPGAVIP